MRLLNGFSMVFLGLSLNVAYADDGPPMSKAGEMTGQITKFHPGKAGTVTLTVPDTAQAQPARPANIRPIRPGQRPSLRQMMPKPTKPPEVKYKDIDLKLLDDVQIRYIKLPSKVDLDGKKVAYTAEEIKKMKEPAGAPGYAAKTEDLVMGQIVKLQLVKSKPLPGEKAERGATDNLYVKTIFIVDEKPQPIPKGHGENLRKQQAQKKQAN